MKLTKLFFLSLILLLICSCNSQSTRNTGVYNTSFYTKSDDYISIDSKVVYRNYRDRQWYVYDTILKNTSSLLLDTSNELLDKTNIRQYIFPNEASVIILKYTENDDGNVEWKVEEVNLDSGISKTVGTNENRSLINEETYRKITKTQEYTAYNPYCDVFECNPLESIINNSIWIYSRKIYKANSTSLRVMDLDGNHQEVLPIQLKKQRHVLSFNNALLYYLDPESNVRRFNQETKKDDLIIEKVTDFYIVDNSIYFSSLDDGYFYRRSLDKGESELMIEEKYHQIKVNEDNIYYIDDDFRLIKTSMSNFDNKVTLAKNVGFFEFVGNDIFIQTFDGLTFTSSDIFQ